MHRLHRGLETSANTVCQLGEQSESKPPPPHTYWPYNSQPEFSTEHPDKYTTTEKLLFDHTWGLPALRSTSCAAQAMETCGWLGIRRFHSLRLPLPSATVFADEPQTCSGCVSHAEGSADKPLHPELPVKGHCWKTWNFLSCWAAD